MKKSILIITSVIKNYDESLFCLFCAMVLFFYLRLVVVMSSWLCDRIIYCVFIVVSKSIVTIAVVSRNTVVVSVGIVFFFALVLFLEIVERAREEFTFTASLLGDAIERVFEFAPSRNWFLFITSIVLRGPRRGGVEVHLVFALVF